MCDDEEDCCGRRGEENRDVLILCLSCDIGGTEKCRFVTYKCFVGATAFLERPQCLGVVGELGGLGQPGGNGGSAGTHQRVSFIRNMHREVIREGERRGTRGIEISTMRGSGHHGRDNGIVVERGGRKMRSSREEHEKGEEGSFVMR